MAKGKKNIYKRGNIWWIRYAGSDGIIRFESSKSSNHEVAEDLLVDKRKAVKDAYSGEFDQ